MSLLEYKNCTILSSFGKMTATLIWLSMNNEHPQAFSRNRKLFLWATSQQLWYFQFFKEMVLKWVNWNFLWDSCFIRKTRCLLMISVSLSRALKMKQICFILNMELFSGSLRNTQMFTKANILHNVISVSVTTNRLCLTQF